MKISIKQQHTIDLARFFSIKTYNNLNTRTAYNAFNVIEDKDGLTPEEAFLLRTDKGIIDMKVQSISGYLTLLVGHNRAALYNKAWAETFREGTIFLSEFENEPDFIREFVYKTYLASFSERYDYVKQLFLYELNKPKIHIFDQRCKKLKFRKRFKKYGVDYMLSYYPNWTEEEEKFFWKTLGILGDSNSTKTIVYDYATASVVRVQCGSLVFYHKDIDKVENM